MERPGQLGGVVLALALLLAVGFALGSWFGPFGSSASPSASITTFEQVESGCRDAVVDSGGVGGNATHVHFFDVVETATPTVNLAASVTRTSPDATRYPTYRVDVTVHPAPGNASACRGRVAFGLNVSLSRAVDGRRVALFVEGDPASCSGVGCDRLLAEPDAVRWANATTGDARIRQAYTTGVRTLWR